MMQTNGRKEAAIHDPIESGAGDVACDPLLTSLRTWLEVGDVMSKNPVALCSEETAITAARAMSESRISCLIAVRGSEVVGILTETDFLRRVSGNDHGFNLTKVAQIMSSPVVTVSPKASVLEASRMMAEKRIKRLPVLDANRLIGVLTQTDLVRALTTYGMWRSVAEIMTEEVVGIQSSATVAEAAERMTAHNISCIVVLEGNEPLGLLTERDLLRRVIVLQRDAASTRLEEVMSCPVLSVPPHYSVFSVSKIMEEKNIRRLVVRENGRMLGIVAQTDVFRAVRTKLQDEEEESQRLLDKSENGVYTIDRSGTTTSANPAFMRLFEVSDPAKILGQPFLPERFWVHPEERPRLLNGLKERSTRIEELALKTATGRRIYVTLFSTPKRNVRGELNGMQGVLYDVTEKIELVTLRKAQEALRESEQRYRLLAEHAKDVIWTSDLNLRWTYISPSIELLRGYTAKECMAHAVEEIMTPASGELARKTLAEELAMARQHHDAPSRVRSLELEFTRKDGTTVWADVKVAFLCGEDDQPFGLLGVVRDITERKRIEQELKQYAAALESANKALERSYAAAEAATRAKSEFLANVSHEIRTPMTAILGFADVLAEKLREPDHLDVVGTIKRNGQYLLRIINDILDLSKIEAGKLCLEQISSSPCQIVEEVASLMRVRADSKGLSLEVHYAGPIPATITTDPVRLRQILINLVGNAVKFTESGTVRIVTRLLRAAGDQPTLQFDVIDTGIGMTEAQIARLFQPFTQGDASTSRRFGGSGLGLAISERLATMLGGAISVASARGKGSTFTVTVAAGPLDGVPILDHPNEPATELGQTAATRPGRQARLDCRILLAEDGLDNQRLISLLLKRAGADVTIAENGRVALEKVLSTIQGRAKSDDQPADPFAIILMDMEMPVMDGYETTRRLRQANYQGPIIALTAHTLSQDRQKCLDAGCNDYVSKPIERDTLLATVAKHAPPEALREHAGTQPPAAAPNPDR